MFKKKSKILKLWSKVFFLTLLLVFLIQTFLVQSYTVSSLQMDTALFKGDRVLVNKTSYGIRLPITLLSIPFTFDSFFGVKSYSDILQLDYHRLFSRKVDRNDIVLFNNPLETSKPLDKRSLFLSRCVAVSGDTINVEEANFSINGIKYVPSPDLLLPFRLKREGRDLFLSLMDTLKIEQRNVLSDSIWVYSTLNRYEAFILDQNLSDSLQLSLNTDALISYKLLVPAKGMVVTLDSQSIPLYSRIIIEENENAKIENSQIIVDDKIISSYQFKNNYYWFLSDNVEDATDSRSFGFISEQDIIGQAVFIWYSSDEQGIRRNRTFSFVK